MAADKIGKYGANTVSMPKLTISNAAYSSAGWSSGAGYWKGHYDTITAQLRETINDQAEMIAELSTTKNKLVVKLGELQDVLDGLKQSIGLDDRITDVRSSMEVDDDEVMIQRAIRKEDVFSPDGEETMDADFKSDGTRWRYQTRKKAKND